MPEHCPEIHERPGDLLAQARMGIGSVIGDHRR